MKPGTKAEGVNAENKSEVEKKASGVKADGEDSLSASKARVCFQLWLSNDTYLMSVHLQSH